MVFWMKHPSGGWASLRLQFVVLILLLSYRFSHSSVAAASGGGGEGGSIEWKILTKQNFSSQIRLHSYVLLMVTVPWCGESRSLMKGLAHAVSHKQHKFGSLKLMLLYRNSEVVLADAIGATDGNVIFFYHHSVSYKYRGRLEVKNILSSAHYLTSFLPEELPLKPLSTPEELENFFESTDKAVLLLEFCGWTPKLLKMTNNGMENTLNVPGGPFGTAFNGETNKTVTLQEKKYQEGMEDENLQCGAKNELNGNWPGEFNFVNKTPDALSCTFAEFQIFDSFFLKFMTTAREFFLPPERQRYGLVSDRSLLSSLGMGDSVSWLVVLYYDRCPSCSKILKEGDDLKDALQMHKSSVIEVEGDGDDLEPALPANRPSILLFVDRSAETSKIRKKSKEALQAFRKFVLQNQIIYQTAAQNNHKLVKKSSIQSFGSSTSDHGSPQSEPSPQTQNTRLKDKMTIMIINEGGHVALDNLASDLQGKSLHEVLTYAIQKEKEAKLSSVAKQVGFQLLSDDLNIKLADILPSNTEDAQSNQISLEVPSKSHISHADVGTDELPPVASVSSVKHEEHPKHTDAEGPHYNEDKPSTLDRPVEEASLEADRYHTNDEHSIVDDAKLEQASLSQVDEEHCKHTDAKYYSQYNEDKTSALDTPIGEISLEAGQHYTNDELAMVDDGKVEQASLPLVDKLGEQQYLPQAFFSDGGYRLLKALTATTKIPSMVIVDPISQQHYVFPEDAVFSYSSLVDFVGGFLNGTLFPYQQSESFISSHREGAHPPFVNLDFYELDGIPQVTAYTFSDMVIGFNESDASNVGSAWKKDVLVFFSNSWCGFCQRMELVVREVYRALKGYLNIQKSAPGKGEILFRRDSFEEVAVKLPLIYSMDCTLNDCSLILKAMGQRELYPLLLLFPAQRKNAVTYQGDIRVSSIMKFIADHGRNSHLITEKGILWAEAEKTGSIWNFYGKSSPAIDDNAYAKYNYHEVILKDRTLKRAVEYKMIISHTTKGFHETPPHVMVGSILVATNKLLGVQLFEESRILIVKADQDTGFQGLIINKHITWDNIDGLGEGLERLKDAPLSLGGPLIKDRMPLLSLSRKCVKDQFPQVLPGVYFLDQSATLGEIRRLKSGNHSFNDYWFFLGFSNWAWNQLFGEISEGSWNVSNETVGQFEWP